MKEPALRWLRGNKSWYDRLMIRFISILAVFLSATVQAAHAQALGKVKPEQVLQEQPQEQDSNGDEEEGDDAFSPEVLSVPVRAADSLPPVEPDIPKVAYLKKEPAKGLQQRVDDLLLGVYVDVPPQYDHYGYEIRRYMARIAGLNVLGNPEALKGQIQNMDNALIVLRFWKQDLYKDIKALESEIEGAQHVQSNIRTTFKYNRGAVGAFFVECDQWIKHNKAFLEYLLEIQGRYQYEDPVYFFTSKKDIRKFVALYKARQAAHEQIVEYAPFRVMIY